VANLRHPCKFQRVSRLGSVTAGHSTPWAIKSSQLIFVCNFVKNQLILMQFSLLDFEMNDTCASMNFTHLTQLMMLHYLVKYEKLKTRVNTTSAYNVDYKIAVISIQLH